MSGVDSPVTAQQVFTNRSDEVAAFDRALVGLADELAAAEVSPVVDRVRGRRNVLVFYGVGGIGKTTLSHELERRLLADARDDAVAIRVDVSEDGATDVEGLVLRLRAALGQLGRRWSAFDLGLAAYWARAHPGEPLQEFLDASPLVRRVAKSVGLGDQIAENVELVVPADLGGLPGLAQKAALGVFRSIRDRVREGRLLADCDLFAELVEADADYETLSYFPYLLAWDLEQLSRNGGRCPLVCVFVDTVESIAGLQDRTPERFLQRVAYLMPNVLFVMTGRNRLDWADMGTSGELDFTGPQRWPNLHFSNHDDEPRQHLVGYLSESDADAYLREALTRDGEPAMPPGIRERIIAGGQGLPLYLDLSVSHFAELVARGGDPAADDFGGSFTAVATRSIRDLPGEERNLVRTAALVDRFDADLLRAGQPTLADGRVARFLRRSFLTRDDSYEMPYALHLALRSAIEEADMTMPDGWSDRDRRDTAERLLVDLGRRAEPPAGRAAVAQALEAGLTLAAENRIFHDWLADATQRLVEAGQWASMAGLLPAAESSTAELTTLRSAIDGVVLRRTGRAVEAVDVLSGADAGVAPGSAVAQLARLHLAHALRNTGDYAGAAGVYQGLVDGRFGPVARYWLCDNDFLQGRFSTALDQLTTMTSDGAAAEGERLRLVGHVLRVNARFDEALRSYDTAVALARSEGLAAAEAKALVNVAQTACWSGDTEAVAAAAGPARELLDVVPNPVEGVKLRAAEAVTAALAGDPAGAAETIEDTRRLAATIAYRGGYNLADVATILTAVLAGDPDAGRSALADLDERTRSSGGNSYWVPIAITWLDGVDAAAARSPEVQWLDGAPGALGRWAQVVR